MGMATRDFDAVVGVLAPVTGGFRRVRRAAARSTSVLDNAPVPREPMSRGRARAPARHLLSFCHRTTVQHHPEDDDIVNVLAPLISTASAFNTPDAAPLNTKTKCEAVGATWYQTSDSCKQRIEDHDASVSGCYHGAHPDYEEEMLAADIEQQGPSSVYGVYAPPGAPPPGAGAAGGGGDWLQGAASLAASNPELAAQAGSAAVGWARENPEQAQKAWGAAQAHV